jgi:hypothetical protein
MKGLHLYHFKPAEFNRSGTNWYPVICPRLLVSMDLLRHELRTPVVISPHPQAVGRTRGRDDNSQHNFDRWAQVRGLDFFVPDASADRVVSAMTRLGFTGIGLYPEGFLGSVTQPRYHGDTRRDRVPGEPATWGYKGDRLVSLKEALS